MNFSELKDNCLNSMNKTVYKLINLVVKYYNYFNSFRGRIIKIKNRGVKRTRNLL